MWKVVSGNRGSSSATRAGIIAVLLVAASLGLGACTVPLETIDGEEPLEQCRFGDGPCMAMVRKAFEQYRRDEVAQIEAGADGGRLPGAPEALLYPYRTR